MASLLVTYPDEENAADSYVVGYTLIPPNMMANFNRFPVFNAFDCAHKRGDGQGIIAVRATKNANGRPLRHPVSLSLFALAHMCHHL